jgi:hypothetical protein
MTMSSAVGSMTTESAFNRFKPGKSLIIKKIPIVAFLLALWTMGIICAAICPEPCITR